MINTQQAQIQLDELKNDVIGLFKMRNSNLFELVVNCQETNNTIDVIRITQFGVIQKEFSLPTHYGRLHLFLNNKTMNQMLDNPFKWAEFMKQFES